MSLGKLENNQTNLEWRNTINEAITTLEAVSGITYTLSAQNPDDNLTFIQSLSTSQTTISNRLSSLPTNTTNITSAQADIVSL